jgi:hypothetical protein
MLRRETDSYEVSPTGVVNVMSDINIITALAKDTVTNIGAQAAALGNGLHNAAPIKKPETPGKAQDIPGSSVGYLLDIAQCLMQIGEQCGKILPPLPTNKPPF